MLLFPIRGIGSMEKVTNLPANALAIRSAGRKDLGFCKVFREGSSLQETIKLQELAKMSAYNCICGTTVQNPF